MNTPTLTFDPSLLTEREAQLISNNWDGSAQLKDDVQAINVAVHNGEFHADEALAIALLRVLSGAEIYWVRTRDPKVLADAELRIDVGEGLLDHHGKRSEQGVAACSRVFALLFQSRSQPKEVWEALDPVVVATAATDTGVSGSTNINPWVHAAAMAARARGENPDEAFNKVVDKMTEFVADLVEAAQAAAKAKFAASDAIVKAGDSKVVAFPAEARLANVKQMLWELKAPCVYYVSPEGESDWRVLCAADPELPFDPFGSRRLIPAKFRGLRGTGLDLALPDGFIGGIFCHQAGFIAGFTSREAAVQFANICLAD